MPITAEHAHRYVYHFCHIENLPSVLEHGILSCNEQKKRGLRHLSIAAKSIQARRATMPVTCGPGGVVHDYVPFYFCKRSSMLLSVVQAKNVDQQLLVYLVAPITLVERPDVVYTSASANTEDHPQFYSEPSDLEKLNWDAIKSLKWTMPTDKEKQARQAELLVHKKLPISDIVRVVVWSEGLADIVRKMFKDAGLGSPSIDYDAQHYFTKFPKEPNKSLVTGPIFAAKRLNDATKSLIDGIGQSASPTFAGLTALRDQLRTNPEKIELFADIVGLKTDNFLHKQDVGEHTLEVVKNLTDSKRYERLNDKDKLLCEIGAFLHDVGKGPKERWKDNNFVQKADPDHPILGVEMVGKYLAKNLAKVSSRSARVILMLVCYHDLIGDIIGKGRDRDQLLRAITDERDLDMLLALSKADTLAVNMGWWKADEVAELRKWAVESLETRAKEASGGNGDD